MSIDQCPPDAAELLAIADDYEAGLNRALASGYEEFGPTWERRQRLIIKALRATASVGDAQGAAQAEIARLRKGIQDYLDGNYISPRAGRDISPKQKCPHGMFYWEACENCIDEHFAAVLSPSHQAPVENNKERQ